MKAADGGSNESILSIVDYRKSTFFKSLKDILSVLSSDMFIQQMFEDKRSIHYIPDRLCEIFKEHLTDDREEIIRDLRNRLEAANVLFSYKSDILINMKIFLEQIFRDVDQLKTQIHEDIQFCRDHVLALTNASIARSFESSTNESQFLKRISECHRLFNNTIPSLRKRYESEIAEKNREIGRLNNQIKGLKKSFERANFLKEKAEDEMSANKSILIQSQAENENLKENQRKCQLFEGRVKALEKELASKNEKLEVFLKEIQSSSSIETSSKSLIVKLRNDLSQSECENRDLRFKLQKIELENQTLKNKQNLIEAEHQLFKSKLLHFNNLQNERDSLFEQCRNLNSKIFQYKSKIEHLKKWNKDMQNEIHELKREVIESTNNRNENESLVSEISQFKEELSVIQNDNYNKDMQISELSSQLNSNQRKLKETDQLLKNSEAKCIEQNDQINYLKNQLEMIDSNRSQFAQEYSKMENSFIKLKKVCRDKIQNEKELIREIDHLNHKIEAVEIENESLSSQLKESNLTISKLNESIEISCSSMKNKEKDLETMIHNKSIFEKEKSLLNQELDKVVTEMNKLRESYSISERQKRKLSQQLTSANSQMKKMSTKIKELIQKSNTLSIEKTSLTTENQKIKTDLASKRSEMRAYSDSLNNLKKKNKELVEQIKIYDNKISLLTNDKNKMSAESDKKGREKDIEIIKLKEELSNVRQNMIQIQREKDDYMHKVKAAEWKAEDFREKLENLENKMKEENNMNKDEIDQVKNEVESKAQQIFDLQQKLSELQTKIKLVERNTEVKKIDEIPKLVNSLNDTISNLEKKMTLVRSLFNIPNNDDIPSQMQKIKKLFDSLNDKEMRYKTLFGTENTFEEIQKMKLRFDDQTQKINRLMTFFEINNPDKLIDEVKTLKRQENELRTQENLIRTLLNESHLNDYPKNNSSLNNSLIESDMNVLKTQLNEEAPIIDQITDFIKASNELKSLNQKKINENSKLREMIDKILQIIDDPMSENVIESVSKMKSKLMKLKNVADKVPQLESQVTLLKNDSQKRMNEIMNLKDETFSISQENFNLKDNTEGLTKENRILQDVLTKLKMIMECTESKSNNQEIVDAVSKMKHAMDNIMMILDKSEYSEIIKTIANMKQTISQSMMLISNDDFDFSDFNKNTTNNSNPIYDSIKKMKKDLSKMETEVGTIPLFKEQNLLLKDQTLSLSKENFNLKSTSNILQAENRKMKRTLSKVTDIVTEQPANVPDFPDTIFEEDEGIPTFIRSYSHENLYSHGSKNNNFPKTYSNANIYGNTDGNLDGNNNDSSVDFINEINDISDIPIVNNVVPNDEVIVDAVDYLKKVFDRISTILNTNRSEEIIDRIVKMKNSVEKIPAMNQEKAELKTRIQKLTQENHNLQENLENILTMKEYTVNQLESLQNDHRELKQNSLQLMKEIEDHKNENTQLQTENHELQSECNELKSECTELKENMDNLKNEINEIKDFSENQSKENLILTKNFNQSQNENNSLKNTLNQLTNAIDDPDQKNIVDTVLEMKQTSRKLQSIVGSNNFVEEVSKLKNYYDRLSRNIDVSPNENIIDAAIEGYKKFKEIENELNSINDQNKSFDELFEDLINHSKTLHQINDIFESNDLSMIKSAFTQNSEKDNIVGYQKDGFNGKNVFEKVTKLSHFFKDSSVLLDSIFTIILGKDTKINFPIPPAISKKLIEFVIEFKKKYEFSKQQNDLFYSKCRSFGVICQPNEGIGPALDLLLTEVIAKERSANIERMHVELNDVRKLAEREREALESQKKKLKAKISELRSSMVKIQESTIVRENELADAIDEAKKAKRNAENERDEDIRIREELLRVVAGEIADFDFLAKRLKNNEFALLQRHRHI
ncbi:hypothetical protein TRFO_23223 [Tritrichomonas foetus]|uniref:Uncharacterized protein n=1 Tax=Tritrichomonas foetus TaxID=1144522 RepID=A0A1J4KBG2_9EUKA|nr:hypothetical protein TRFO_23223 [Tritrichomonas foetus]|eukprot:OHT08240.1 hypothetical protein TRFO_23223 [Tritrichomonas foetus]